MVSTVRLAALLAPALAVLACEGECIVGITNKYLALYNPIILGVLQNMADRIDAQCIPPANRRRNSIGYFTPVINAFNRSSYNGLEHAIFPSYFHGKCLYPNGTVPNGCPNPDCPVVCGTPGSMVHFYSILTRIIFNQVSGQITNLTSPKNRAYQQVRRMVLADAQTKQRRSLSRVSRYANLEARARTTTEKHFRTIMKGFPAMLRAACGGWNLSQCSWETYMKEFILQYP